MFILAVPHTRDCYEGRRDRSLGETQQKSDSGESGEVGRSSQAHANHTPDDHCHTNKFGEMQSTHQVDERILRDQLAYIKDGSAPGILLARHVQVGNEIENLYLVSARMFTKCWFPSKWHEHLRS